MRLPHASPKVTVVAGLLLAVGVARQLLQLRHRRRIAGPGGPPGGGSGGTAGVREPRHPRPSPPADAVALPTPEPRDDDVPAHA